MKARLYTALLRDNPMPTMPSFHSILEDQDVLAVSGEDSEKFLQGQLTCDLQKLPLNGWQFGAACTNKGRAFSSFRLLRLDEGFYLIMEPGMLPATRDALQKYIPFYKAGMAATGDAFTRIGLAGTGVDAVLQEWFTALPAPGQAVRQDGQLLMNLTANNAGDAPRFELWLAGTSAVPAPIAALAERPLASWQALDLAAGTCLVHPETAALYTPEELNMDLAGFVSFHKGCYTGQEIVARMHFRGKARKRLYLVEARAPLAERDNRLLDADGNDLGALFHVTTTVAGTGAGQVVLNIDKVPETGHALGPDGAQVPVSITGYTYPPG